MKKKLDINQLIELPVEQIKKLYDITHNNVSSNIIDWDYLFWSRFLDTLDIPTLQEILLKETGFLNIQCTTQECYITYGNEPKLYGTEQIDVLFEAVLSILGFIEVDAEQEG